MQISEISAKIEQLQYELNIENQRGGLKDAAKVEKLESEIAELKAELEKPAVIVNFLESLDFEKVNPKELFLNYSEEGAQKSFDYVNTVVQNAVAKLIQAAESKATMLETELAALQEKNEKLHQEKEELSHDLSIQNLEVSDLNARLSNATRLLDEEKAEVARLNSQIDDLRKEIAVGASAALKVEEVDVRSAHEKWMEQRQKEEDAKPIIYNIRWKDDIRRDTYLAELAATDETIEIPYFAMTGDLKSPTDMKGRYRVVTSEEAPSFRTATDVREEDYAYDIPVGSEVKEEITYPAFRAEESTTSGLDQTDASGEMAGTTVEKRLAALELAVFGVTKGEAA